ncbi:monovalent cation/H+ antiporter complex subunit F [Planctomonas psychrotolerans]|uniref:monovalent cation/H+ antiporter complex subunit F n=1 Tax=Planctomonas psychrotolerans TaxID=2528712 RepID=UPI00123B9261|nr:monovalent cation/H+ antiporter complex subunit F [Planctomonas psychrotolerans]
MTILQASFIAVGVVFFVAAALAVFRIVRGPSILDRMIATDMLVATLICTFAAEMVYSGHTRSLTIMLILAMVAFIATVAVTRYVSKQDPS